MLAARKRGGFPVAFLRQWTPFLVSFGVLSAALVSVSYWWPTNPNDPCQQATQWNASHGIPHQISTISYKLWANHLIGDYNVPCPFQTHIRSIKRKDFRSVANRIKQGDVIFVEADRLQAFVAKSLPAIRERFTLISGDGDLCIPECVLSSSELNSILSNPYIQRWFTTNCSFNKQLLGLIECIPIGVNQHDTDSLLALKRLVDEGVVVKPSDTSLPKRAYNPQDRILLVTFSILSNPKVRTPVWDYFCLNKSTVIDQTIARMTPTRMATQQISNCFFDPSKGREDFWKQTVATSPFVLSPGGQGLDCYRTWEALLLGAIVVVKTSKLDSLYQELPVLIVQKWSDVTVELLNATFHEFQGRTFDYSKLYSDHWRQRIVNQNN